MWTAHRLLDPDLCVSGTAAAPTGRLPALSVRILATMSYDSVNPSVQSVDCTHSSGTINTIVVKLSSARSH